MKCSQCDSTNILRNLRVLDRVGEDDKNDLALETHLSPQALFITEAVSIPVAANVCLNCGGVMFSLSSGEDLEKVQRAAAALEKLNGDEGEDQDSSRGFGSFLGGEAEGN